MACVMVGVNELKNDIYLDQRDRDYMRNEVTVAQLDVLFRDSIGEPEKK